jgi:hypothetical protein
MRTRITMSLAVLLLAAAPAFAQTQPPDDDDTAVVPEPGVLALIGIGAAAVLIGRRNKK